MQILYGNWSAIVSSQAALTDVLKLLAQPLPNNIDDENSEFFSLQNSIVFDDVSFRYRPEAPFVLNGLSFQVSKGARFGIIGSTGSGKSTTIDLLMGLLESTEGKILIDGRELGIENKIQWQKAISHVSQNIFLTDGTITENIAFGVLADQINHALVRRAAQRAQISEFIESNPEGYSATCGERGIRLSGGQRQRIGIARALYKNSQVIVFDEATSSLDIETERAVMQSIEHLDEDLTLIIIAHRLTTLKNCTQIIELDKGMVKSIGSYQDVISKLV
jgi:ATP-binding cassette subfamily B protein